MTNIELTEYERKEVPDLDRGDWTYLARTFSRRQLEVDWDGIAGCPSVRATSYIGVLSLPSGRQLHITTKVPVASIFTMLATAKEWPFSPEDLGGYHVAEGLLEVVARYFLDLALTLDDQGLYRRYHERAGNLAVVRGHIAFAEDVRHNAVERQRTYCAYSEFSRDIPDNQILRQVLHHLAESGLVPTMTTELRALSYWWSDIELTRFEHTIVDSFTYHRLNEQYRLPHMLADLLLQWLSPTEGGGSARFPTFLVNMNWLYEEFVRVILQRAAGTLRVRKPPLAKFDEDGLASFQPDVVVARGKAPCLVLDCKYKKTSDEATISGDAYQMVAYCTALGLRAGVLMYPKHLANVSDELRVVNSDLRLHRRSFDLGIVSTDLVAASIQTARDILRLVEPSESAAA